MDKDLEEIIKRIEENATKIENNMEKIHKNSYALEILGDYKQESTRLYDINKKLFVLILILLLIIIAMGVYIVIL